MMREYHDLLTIEILALEVGNTAIANRAQYLRCLLRAQPMPTWHWAILRKEVQNWLLTLEEQHDARAQLLLFPDSETVQ